MLANSKLIYLFLYVRHLDRARAFFEETLGFHVLETDPGAAKYDAGSTILALNRASDFGRDLPRKRDETSLIVFHTDEIDETIAALEARGVECEEPLRYEIGATSGFFDPDGHYLQLYEPSQEAMTWPSAGSIREILSRPAPADGESTPGPWRLVYLFLFVEDPARSLSFYSEKLGLRILEEDAGSQVVKYDAGVIIATHPPVGDPARALARPKFSSMVFHTPDVEAAYRDLAERGVEFTSGVAASAIGKIAGFEDPDGHAFYLYEPSTEALTWPSARKIEEILANAVPPRA